VMTPFESAVRRSLEGSRGGRAPRASDMPDIDHADRVTPLSGTQLVHNAGSRLPFQSSSRLSRRRTVRCSARRMVLARLKSNQTSLSTRSASHARTALYCYFVTQLRAALDSSTSASSSSRGVHPRPSNRASISTWRIPSCSPMAGGQGHLARARRPRDEDALRPALQGVCSRQQGHNTTVGTWVCRPPPDPAVTLAPSELARHER
jgi:hypothetical protein